MPTLHVESGLLSIWQGFSLEILSPLVFEQGCIYHLSGPNGSGKSSFIKQILLPRLSQNPDIYLLYIEQQMHLQLQVVKAYARMFGPHIAVNTESEAVRYLLADLSRVWQSEGRPCYILMDESRLEEDVIAFTRTMADSVCLIYTSHSGVQTSESTVIFEPQTTSLSRVYGRDS